MFLVVGKFLDIVIVERELLFGWICEVDFGIRIEIFEFEWVVDEIIVDWVELWVIKIVVFFVVIGVNRVIDELIDVRSVDVIVRVVLGIFWMVFWVIFDDVIFEWFLFENKVDDELSILILFGIIVLDLILLVKNVMFIDFFVRDELIVSVDWELDRFFWLVIVERLFVWYFIEFGSEVIFGVGVIVIGGVVWIIEEIGKIEIFCVEEIFVIFGFRLGEEVMLCFIFLLEVVSIVCGRFEVNVFENCVVVIKDVIGGELLIKVCVFIVLEIFEFWIVFIDDEGVLFILIIIKDVFWEELFGVMFCVDFIFDMFGVSNDLLWVKFVVWFDFNIVEFDEYVDILFVFIVNVFIWLMFEVGDVEKDMVVLELFILLVLIIGVDWLIVVEWLFIIDLECLSDIVEFLFSCERCKDKVLGKIIEVCGFLIGLGVVGSIEIVIDEFCIKRDCEIKFEFSDNEVNGIEFIVEVMFDNIKDSVGINDVRVVFLDSDEVDNFNEVMFGFMFLKIVFFWFVIFVFFFIVMIEFEIVDNILIECNVCGVWERELDKDVEFDSRCEFCWVCVEVIMLGWDDVV